MDDFFESRSERITGGVVTVVTPEGVLFEQGYGYADVEKKLSVDPGKTDFLVASVSKLFTTTAIMQLVEEGTLRLDEDINRYLRPPFRLVKIPLSWSTC